MLAILLISAALCYTFGEMVSDRRQGWAILVAMSIIFVGLLALSTWAEQAGNPLLAKLEVDQTASAMQAGGNMEGDAAGERQQSAAQERAFSDASAVHPHRTGRWLPPEHPPGWGDIEAIRLRESSEAAAGEMTNAPR